MSVKINGGPELETGAPLVGETKQGPRERLLGAFGRHLADGGVLRRPVGFHSKAGLVYMSKPADPLKSHAEISGAMLRILSEGRIHQKGQDQFVVALPESMAVRLNVWLRSDFKFPHSVAAAGRWVGTTPPCSRFIREHLGFIPHPRQGVEEVYSVVTVDLTNGFDWTPGPVMAEKSDWVRVWPDCGSLPLPKEPLRLLSNG